MHKRKTFSLAIILLLACILLIQARPHLASAQETESPMERAKRAASPMHSPMVEAIVAAIVLAIIAIVVAVYTYTGGSDNQLIRIITVTLVVAAVVSGIGVGYFALTQANSPIITPSPTPSATPLSSAAPTFTPTPTITPSLAPSPTPPPTASPTLTPTPSPTSTATSTPTATPTPTPIPKSTPTFSLTTNATSGNLKSTIKLSGTLSIPKTGTITLYWAIDNSGFVYHSTENIDNGEFSRNFGFSQTGKWQFKVNWAGDETSNPAESNMVEVTIIP